LVTIVKSGRELFDQVTESGERNLNGSCVEFETGLKMLRL
jgi:hypothetical protein